mgnify:CR=1 FL=1
MDNNYGDRKMNIKETSNIFFKEIDEIALNNMGVDELDERRLLALIVLMMVKYINSANPLWIQAN